LSSPRSILMQARSQQSSTPKSRPWNARVKWITRKVLSKLSLIVPVSVILLILVVYYYRLSTSLPSLFPIGSVSLDGDVTTVRMGPISEEYNSFDEI